MKLKSLFVASLAGLVVMCSAGVSRGQDWSVKVVPDKPSPQARATVGTVTFTASAAGTGFSGVEYQFWLYSDSSARYTLMRGYATTATWAWTPGAADSYVVQVRARNGGSTATFEKSAAISYYVLAEAPVAAVTLIADKPSPQQVGTPVTFAAAAAGGGSSGAEYQFWLYSTASRAYRLVKDYPEGGNSWTPSAGDMGTADAYAVRVYARTRGSLMSFEKSAARSFTMVAQAPVTSVALNVDKPSPQVAGTPFTFTASASGGGTAGVEYQFWLSSSAGSAYRMVKDYPDSDGTWTPGAGDMDAADSYVVLVYVRSRGSTTPYEKTAARSYTVLPLPTVTAVTLGVDKTSPQLAGTPLTFTAAAEGGGSGVEYRFWLAPAPTGPYEPVGDLTTGYSAADTWHWTPAAAGTYRVMVHARTAGSAADFESARELAYVVDSNEEPLPPCESCHNGSAALAPNVMGDGTLAGGDPAHATPKAYDDGTYGFNVNGHGRDADTNGISRGMAINAACSDCHAIAVPAGRHLDGVLDGRTPSPSNNNPFHLRPGFINTAPANEWDVQVTFDNYCWTACHQGKTVDMRHDLDSRGLHATPHVVELGRYNSYAAPNSSPSATMFYDANITWLGGFNGPPNFGLCVSCHNPHGTNVGAPTAGGNNYMSIFRWSKPSVLCSRCHL